MTAGIVKFNNWSPRAQWVVKGYEALQVFVAKAGLPPEAYEAFSDFADALGMNRLIPRLRSRIEENTEPTRADIDDLHSAELRIPVLLRASDALRAKITYGSKSEELRYLTDMSVAAIQEIVGEASLGARATPWTYLAITMSLAMVTWLITMLATSRSHKTAAVQVPA